MYKMEWNVFFRFLYLIIMFKIIYYNNKSRVFLNISTTLQLLTTNTMNKYDRYNIK